MFQLSSMRLLRSLYGNFKDITMMVKTDKDTIIAFTDGVQVFVYNYCTGELLNEFTAMKEKEAICRH